MEQNTQHTKGNVTVQLFYRDGAEAIRVPANLLTRSGSYKWETHEREDCHRCGGAGGWKGWPGFTCYDCGGAGKKVYRYKHTGFTAERLARLNELAEARRRKTESKEHARRRKIIENAAPLIYELRKGGAFDVLTDAAPMAKEGSLLFDFGRRASDEETLAQWITEARLQGLLKTAERIRELAKRPKLETGRREVTGAIRSFKEYENQFGTVTKILVEEENGNRVFGTLPRAIDNAQQGQKVRFVATVEASGDDEHFGFFSRPAKAGFAG